jgi:predicted RNA polymerase sigma factor
MYHAAHKELRREFAKVKQVAEEASDASSQAGEQAACVVALASVHSFGPGEGPSAGTVVVEELRRKVDEIRRSATDAKKSTAAKESADEVNERAKAAKDFGEPVMALTNAHRSLLKTVLIRMSLNLFVVRLLESGGWSKRRKRYP